MIVTIIALVTIHVTSPKKWSCQLTEKLK